MPMSTKQAEHVYNFAVEMAEAGCSQGQIAFSLQEYANKQRLPLTIGGKEWVVWLAGLAVDQAARNTVLRA